MAYNNDNAIHRYLKLLMALPCLPHQEIPASFHWLKLQATTPVLHELVYYVNNNGSTPTLFHPVPGASTDSLSVPIMISRDGTTPSTDALVVEFIYLSTYLFSCSIESPLCAPSNFDSSTPENFKASSVKNIAHFKQESLATGRTTLRVKFQVGDSLKHALT